MQQKRPPARLPPPCGPGPGGEARFDQLSQHLLALCGNRLSDCTLLRWRGLSFLARGGWLYRDAPAGPYRAAPPPGGRGPEGTGKCSGCYPTREILEIMAARIRVTVNRMGSLYRPWS